LIRASALQSFRHTASETTHPIFKETFMRPILRRKAIACTAALLTAALASPWTQAQNYPTKPIKFVVPFTAGSATDAVGRIVAQAMGDALGQSVTV